MKERQILFSAPMVRAILDGRKTMTRRVVKLRDKDLHDDSAYLNGGSAAIALGHGVGGIVQWLPQNGEWFGVCGYTTVANIDCPYGQVGSTLWVRENGWERPDRTPKMMREGADTWAGYYYDAEKGFDESDARQLKEWGFKRRPSIHMPRWASRIDLEIVSIRVERLQEISEADAIAEGCAGFYAPMHPDQGQTDGQLPHQEFADLWETINGAGSWAANPWVWVVEFKRVERNTKEG